MTFYANFDQAFNLIMKNDHGVGVCPVFILIPQFVEISKFRSDNEIVFSQNHTVYFDLITFDASI